MGKGHQRRLAALAAGSISVALAACGSAGDDSGLSPEDAALIGGQRSTHTGGSLGGRTTGGAHATGGDPVLVGGGGAVGGTAQGGMGGDAEPALGGGVHATGGLGVGGQLPCPPVEPVCEPLQEGCSSRGEKYVCSACGQEQPQGESCGRLLVSDKEGGLTCVVRGESSLSCAGGNTVWSENLNFPVELPEFPTLLVLPDDTGRVTSNELLQYCWLTEQGEVGCTADYQAPNRDNCTDVAISDGQLCSICSGIFSCEGGDTSAIPAREVEMSDSFALWLSTEGDAYGGLSPLGDTTFPGQYEDLFLDGSSTPCGLTADGALVCSVGNPDGTTYRLAGEFSVGSMENGRICLIEKSGAARCVSLLDGQYVPIFGPSGDDFTWVVTNHNHSCALTKTGEVVCWDNEGLREDVSEGLN
jgi:hypothetical protein